MNFTILTPNDSPLQENKSDTSDSNFGGHREHSDVAKAQDYTSRTGASPNKKENPVDTTVRDIDDMTDPHARKREFSYQDELSDCQKGNEADWRTESGSDNRPDEEDDPVKVPEAINRKQYRKSNKWQFDSSNRYEGEIS